MGEWKRFLITFGIFSGVVAVIGGFVVLGNLYPTVFIVVMLTVLGVSALFCLHMAIWEDRR